METVNTRWIIIPRDAKRIQEARFVTAPKLKSLALATQHRHTIVAEVTVGCPYFSKPENTVYTERIRAKK